MEVFGLVVAWPAWGQDNCVTPAESGTRSASGSKEQGASGKQLGAGSKQQGARSGSIVVKTQLFSTVIY